MAKLMVMIDVPNHDYEELREFMVKKQPSVIPGFDFAMPKSKDGYAQVSVHQRYLDLLRQKGTWFRFELIGVRP